MSQGITKKQLSILKLSDEIVMDIDVSSIGTVKTVNGIKPDLSGDIQIDIPEVKVETVNGVSPDEDKNIQLPIDDDFDDDSINPLTNKFVTSVISHFDAFKHVYKLSDGTEEHPYLIYDKYDLLALKEVVDSGVSFDGKFFKQMTDIDMSGTPWEGIGTWANDNPVNPFSGTYDGGNHEIRNIVFDSNSNKNSEFLGLFSSVVGATIKNLNVNVNGFTDYTVNSFGAGGVVGITRGNLTLENIQTSGTLGTVENPAKHTTAGVVAYVAVSQGTAGRYKTKLTNVTNNVNVVSTRKCAGILGFTQEIVELDNVANYGNIERVTSASVDKDDAVGGIIGYGQNAIDTHETIMQFNNVSNYGILKCADSKTAKSHTGQIIGRPVTRWEYDEESTHFTGENHLLVSSDDPDAIYYNTGVRLSNIAMATEALDMWYGVRDGNSVRVMRPDKNTDTVYVVMGRDTEETSKGDAKIHYAMPITLQHGEYILFDETLGYAVVRDIDGNPLSGVPVSEGSMVRRYEFE